MKKAERVGGWVGVCLLGLVSLWMPWSWIETGHRWLGWGEFPAAPLAEYLARSVAALSAFYGGLWLRCPLTFEGTWSRLAIRQQILADQGRAFRD